MPAIYSRVLASRHDQEAVIGVRDAVRATHKPPSRVALQGAVLSWGPRERRPCEEQKG